LRKALEADRAFRALLIAEAHHKDERLILRLPAGHALATARRVINRPSFVALVNAHYPRGTQVVLEPLAHTLSVNEAARERRRSALNNPSIRRIIESLGAKLDRVDELEGDDRV
jgi:hypothetical protein